MFLYSFFLGYSVERGQDRSVSRVIERGRERGGEGSVGRGISLDTGYVGGYLLSFLA